MPTSHHILQKFVNLLLTTGLDLLLYEKAAELLPDISAPEPLVRCFGEALPLGATGRLRLGMGDSYLLFPLWGRGWVGKQEVAGRSVVMSLHGSPRSASGFGSTQGYTCPTRKPRLLRQASWKHCHHVLKNVNKQITSVEVSRLGSRYVFEEHGMKQQVTNCAHRVSPHLRGDCLSILAHL